MKSLRIKGKGHKKKVLAGDIVWYYAHEGDTVGPLNDEELCAAADAGEVLPSDEIWRNDLHYRLHAYDVDGLFPQLTEIEEESEGVSQERMASDTLIFQTSPSDTGSVMCPYCWYRCEREDLLYIARHPDLRGDPILGSDEAMRFLPSHFTPEGHAIDSKGVVCPESACPRCHMRFPRAMISMPPLFFSIVGAPASGKSYFLTSMCRQLRRTLPRDFMIRFTDADGTVNRWLNAYEERLFAQADPDAPQAIDKTQLQGQLYREITHNDMRISLPLPSVMTMQAEESSVHHREAKDFVNRSLVLYDNAGEHFEPGRDSASDPGTHHMVHSDAIVFTLDPTQEPAFRRLLDDYPDPQFSKNGAVHRQDVLLTEAVNRIRMYGGRDAQERYAGLLIVLLSKADTLTPIVGDLLDTNPWQWDEGVQACALDLSRLLRTSFHIRSLLERHVPDMVSTIEGLATDVLYVPVSALGHSPSRDPDYAGQGNAPLVVRPRDIKPKWVEVPLLYVLFRMGYIGALREEDPSIPLPETFEMRGDRIHFTVPGTSVKMQLPLIYAGEVLELPDSGLRFRVPGVNTDETL